MSVLIEKNNNITKLHQGVPQFHLVSEMEIKHIRPHPLIIRSPKLDINLFNKIKNIFIVHKFDVAPIYRFFCVFLLFHLENVLQNNKRNSLTRVAYNYNCFPLQSRKYLIEMLLQLLIREINTKLFKTATKRSLLARARTHKNVGADILFYLFVLKLSNP